MKVDKFRALSPAAQMHALIQLDRERSDLPQYAGCEADPEEADPKELSESAAWAQMLYQDRKKREE